MKRAFVLDAKEDWIVDRFVKEWSEDNSDMVTLDISAADGIWLLASWRWRSIPSSVLSRLPVVATVHHIVPDKFDAAAHAEFSERDSYVDVYQVYNQQTLEHMKSLTTRPVCLVPYWANQRIWYSSGNKIDFRRKYGIPLDAYVIGSFQRDTEGKDLTSPKLEKGPDLFADLAERKWFDWQRSTQPSEQGKPHVLLAGWRRQYVIRRLKASGVPFTYIERPVQATINELYQCLDLYAVTSRHEGGPQALIECGLVGVPCVSTDVGIATQVLPYSAIGQRPDDAIPAVPDVERWKIPAGYAPYRDLLQQAFSSTKVIR